MKRLQDAIADEIEDRTEVCDFDVSIDQRRPRKRAARLLPSPDLDKPMNTILDFLTKVDGDLDVEQKHNIISDMKPDDTIASFVDRCLSHSEWSFTCAKANLHNYKACDPFEARELLLACFELVGEPQTQFAQEICVFVKP
jgi:hypothetical protein